MALWIDSGPLGLTPDEAQYWTWSQALDFGYYSKPPGVAWQIAAGTHLLGDTVLGVRFPSILLSFITMLALFLLMRVAGLSRKLSFWGVFVFSLTPLALLGSFYATTDVGLILFWTLACAVIVRAINNQEAPSYLLFGLLIGFGALFKWPIYLLWIFVFLFWFREPILRSWTAIGGGALSLLGLLPSLYWNASRGWPTFTHVAFTIAGGHGEKASSNVLDFIGAQFFLFSPVLLILFFVGLWRIRTASRPVFFCGALSGTLLLGYVVASCFQKIQGNWCVFIYPTAAVVSTWMLSEFVPFKRKVWTGVAASLALIPFLLITSISSIQSNGWFSQLPIPFKTNPFKATLGWDQLAPALQKSGYQPDQFFLFGDTYQTASLLSFYGPTQQRAYFFNLFYTRENQFSFWPSMDQEQLGKNGYYVWVDTGPLDRRRLDVAEQNILAVIEPYFEEVVSHGYRPLFAAYGQPVRQALILECRGYDGRIPSQE